MILSSFLHHIKPIKRLFSSTPTKIKFSFKCNRSNKVYPIDELSTTNSTLLEIAHHNDVPLEGACDHSAACSTCHVILPKEIYDGIPEPTEDELDMLDLAYGLTETSRLGCQVKLNRVFNNSTIEIPEGTRNISVDGYIPKPH
jgi:ferredoxin-2, mitochondrial